ncbi:unnamed protein product [Pylaiella littoralis]
MVLLLPFFSGREQHTFVKDIPLSFVLFLKVLSLSSSGLSQTSKHKHCCRCHAFPLSLLHRFFSFLGRAACVSARGFNKLVNYSEEQLGNLDECARNVAGEVRKICRVMRRVMLRENPKKFKQHQLELEAEVEEYIATLPEKMEPCGPYVKALFAQPQRISIKGLSSDKDMRVFYTAFVESKTAAEKTSQSQKDVFEAKANDSAPEDGNEDDDESVVSKSKKGEGAPALTSPSKKAAAASPKGAGKAKGKRTDDGDDEQATTAPPQKEKKKERPLAKILPSKDVADEQAASRGSVTNIFEEDMLAPEWKASTTSLPSDCSVMLFFLNFAVNPAVLTEIKKMKFLFMELASALHQGTLAMAMDTCESFSFSELKRVIEEAGLIMESAPPCSVVLSGKHGRLPVATKLHYPAQTSTVLVVHKTAEFICNGGGGLYGGRHAQTRSKTTTTLEPPRQQMLEEVGVVLSAKHPTDGTYLTNEMAHHLLCRFSNIGDMIISTAADKDELARLVLSNGRKFTGFVTDPANKKALEELLSEAVSDAMMRGSHAHLRGRSKDVTVGGGDLACFRPSRQHLHSQKGEARQGPGRRRQRHGGRRCCCSGTTSLPREAGRR